jgi:predicted nucleic acid-binding protein
MARVFWDAMLFIYLMEEDAVFGERVSELRARSLERRDEICTSTLALGEVMAGMYRDGGVAEAEQVREDILAAGIMILPFDLTASSRFGFLRAKHRRSAADTIHLACAAAADVDLFLTGDKALLKLHVDGIKFIAGLNTDLL